MKTKKPIGATTGLLATLTLLLFIACTPPPTPDPPAAKDLPSGDPAPGAEGSRAESWQCRNDLEVSCGEGACEARAGEGFTPMSVTADGSGAMSVCAYSGCWEGTGEAVRSGEFLVLIGHDLEFSTARDSQSAGADIVIVIDRGDGVGTLKAGSFAHPLLCENSGTLAP